MLESKAFAPTDSGLLRTLCFAIMSKIEKFGKNVAKFKLKTFKFVAD